MTHLTALGTYLPPWGDERARILGRDEDAVTLGVAAARVALRDARTDAVDRIVFVTRDMPLLDGGNGAALLAGVGLPDDVAVVEQLGGAPDALEAVACARPGTLVIAADEEPAGAAAMLVGDTGPALGPVGRVARSLPVHSRDRAGVVRDYEDPRLLRERGLGVAVERLALPEKPVVVAGVPVKQAATLCAGRPPALPTSGASAALFALAAFTQGVPPGVVLTVEQASAAAVTVDGPPPMYRDERAPRTPQSLTDNPGPDIAISLAAYERAFEPKLRWEADRCPRCGTLAFPPRTRCLGCGHERRGSRGADRVALPRTGEVYTTVTVHVPVPGLPTPYSLAIVELDGVDVRALVPVTGAPAGSVGIGDRATLVLRRVAVRSGVPDYGYALLPNEQAPTETEGSAL